MVLGSLRRYDVQARVAAWLASSSLLPLIAAGAIVWRNYKPDLSQIIYRSNAYVIALFSCLVLAMAMAGVAAVLGFGSAGQRINDRPGLSWFGFFVGGGVVTIAVILGISFYLLRLQQPGS